MNLKDMLAYGSRVFVKSGPPVHLIFFITSRCNLRCEHCFYWEALDSDHSHELTIDEIEKISKSVPRLLVLSLTGGEPFVRRDIDQIVSAFVRNSRTQIVTMSTNGAYHRNMENMLQKTLEAFPSTHFIIYLSLDGPEEVHDRIRGVGSHRTGMNTLELLQSYRKRFKNFSTSVSMTCNRLNEAYLGDYFEEIKASGLTDNVNIGFVRGDPKDPSSKDLGIEKYLELTRRKTESINSGSLAYFKFLLSRIVAQKDYYTYQAVESVLRTDQYVAPCYAGSLVGVLYDDGRLSPCEILQDADFGNIRDFDCDLSKIWSTKRGDDIRSRIIDGKCYCTYECAMSTSILFNPKYLAGSVVRALKGT